VDDQRTVFSDDKVLNALAASHFFYLCYVSTNQNILLNYAGGHAGHS
jgi:hypothetical protein